MSVSVTIDRAALSGCITLLTAAIEAVVPPPAIAAFFGSVTLSGAVKNSPGTLTCFGFLACATSFYKGARNVDFTKRSLTIVSGSARGNDIDVTTALFTLLCIDLSAAFESTDHSQIVKRIFVLVNYICIVNSVIGPTLFTLSLLRSVQLLKIITWITIFVHIVPIHSFPRPTNTPNSPLTA